MAPHIGDAGQLQKPLHGAVLAVGPMEDGENDIDPLPDHTVPLKGEKPLAPHRGDGCPAIARVLLPLAGGKEAVVPAGEVNPVAPHGDTDGKYVIFGVIDVVQHGFCRAQ